MANYPSLYARSPSATRDYLNSVVATETHSATNSISLKPGVQHSAESVVVRIENERSERAMESDETRLSLKVIEKVNRSIMCGWHDCPALLGSLENLRKHVQKRHCQMISLEELGSTMSSKPYRCLYDTCQNRTYQFHGAHGLFEHFLEIHFNSLKLRCPVSKCKHRSHSFYRLVHHMSTLHDSNIENLPQSMIVPLSEKGPLPVTPLPGSIIINPLIEMSMVKPNNSFIAAEAMRKMKELTEISMYEQIGSEDDAPKSTFTSTDILKTAGSNGQLVRPVARVPYFPAPEPDDDILRQDDLPAFDADGGPTVGYAVWKRRFAKAEDSGKLPLAYRSSKRRR